MLVRQLPSYRFLSLISFDTKNNLLAGNLYLPLLIITIFINVFFCIAFSKIG